MMGRSFQKYAISQAAQGRTISRWRIGLALIVLLLFGGPAAAAESAGTITARLRVPEAVKLQRVTAVPRIFTELGVSEGSPVEGKLDGDLVTFEGLAVPGQYFLRLTTNQGTIEGWDARVPPSDYVEEEPLDPAGRDAILAKLTQSFATGYDDQVIVLDVQGNIQNAAVLLTHLRTRAFVTGAGVVEGEWTWRISRWQYENPEEDTWAPYQERPYYALVRRRLSPEAYRGLNITYARHLGGLSLTEDHPVLDLGTIVVPEVRRGIHAVHPDGRPTAEVLLKGAAGGASGGAAGGASGGE